MNKLPSSIFNDVIGLLVRQSLYGKARKITVDLDINGSLAESYHGHGSDIGFASGILGLELNDETVPEACEIAARNGIDIEYRILDYGAVHPGNYRIKACADDGLCMEWEAISVGGGMIKMEKFNGFDVSICGDFYELLVTVGTAAAPLDDTLARIKDVISSYEDITSCERSGKVLITIKRRCGTAEALLADLKKIPAVQGVTSLVPILPTQSSADCQVPFINAGQLSAWMHCTRRNAEIPLRMTY